MSDYPETVSISEAKKEARENKENSYGITSTIAKTIVEKAFGGEIPDKDGSDRLSYGVYDGGSSWRRLKITGVKIETRESPGSFNKFYRGTRNSRHGSNNDELDAGKIRDKWHEVCDHAAKVQRQKKAQEKRRKQRNEKKASVKEEFQELRDRLDMTYDFSTRFKLDNGFRGEIETSASGGKFTAKGLTADQAEQLVDLLETFEKEER